MYLKEMTRPQQQAEVLRWLERCWTNNPDYTLGELIAKVMNEFECHDIALLNDQHMFQGIQRIFFQQ